MNTLIAIIIGIIGMTWIGIEGLLFITSGIKLPISISILLIGVFLFSISMILMGMFSMDKNQAKTTR